MSLPPPSTQASPDVETLTVGLSSVLMAAGRTSGPITILVREQHDYVSTYPSEVVTCTLEDGTALRLLCKYSADRDHGAYGHRGGIPHEAEVYRSVLQPIAASAPRCYGTYRDPATGWTWLVLEYLGGAWRMDKMEGGVQRAAEWAGAFHASNESRVSSPFLSFLPRYDRAFYRSWIDRTIQFASPIQAQFSWVGDLDRYSEEIVHVLEAAPATVIHGEFVPPNVLISDGVIVPIDWESAAVAPGEIDLASLTLGWPEEDVRACETEYSQARWPDGAPPGFPRTLHAARIYFQARWLGQAPNWPAHPGYRWNREHLCGDIARWGSSDSA